MNKYECIPLVLMKSDKAGVLEYLQLSHCQGSEGTNRPRWPCLTSPGASPHPAHGPGPHSSPLGLSVPAAAMQQQCGSPAPHRPAWPSQGSVWPWVPALGLTLTCGLTSQLDPGPGPSRQTCPMTWALG